MEVGFKVTSEISAFHHYIPGFEFRSWLCDLNTALVFLPVLRFPPELIAML